ncbi:helix-turn-helix transcriptional regulator [Sodalis glossinidius]|uniref:helix-turn-helix transcriptional regulator n=1 Tax=Sodalis glossinidius TaxID=63612 RepID=UPI000321D558|nr:LuxR C-terminal-related transcriptional regulator [Sodalis glossinidius]
MTPDQLEIAILLSLGLSQKEIAVIRGVAPKTIEIMLGTIKKKFDFPSLNNLLSLFQVRLVFFALSECKRHSHTRSSSSVDNGDEGGTHV